MNPILNRNLFFVKEHTGIFKAANNYDIFNPENGEKLLECREPSLGLFTKIFRFTDYKRMTPFNIEIRDTNGQLVCSVKRNVSWFISKVAVYDENEQLAGLFKQKFLRIGGKFDVLDANENVLCTLQGKWTGWDFKFTKDGIQYAHVTKKWAGIGKELFTTADNYILSIAETVPANDPIRLMILSAIMCIDLVLKE